jgi:hypothetical protein
MEEENKIAPDLESEAETISEESPKEEESHEKKEDETSFNEEEVSP